MLVFPAHSTPTTLPLASTAPVGSGHSPPNMNLNQPMSIPICTLFACLGSKTEQLISSRHEHSEIALERARLTPIFNLPSSICHIPRFLHSFRRDATLLNSLRIWDSTNKVLNCRAWTANFLALSSEVTYRDEENDHLSSPNPTAALSLPWPFAPNRP
jgi:hypothetical protein